MIQHAVLQEAGREQLQSSGTEYDIGCPFILVHGPVIIRLKLAEDLIVQWVEAPCERRPFVFPVGFHLVVEKTAARAHSLQSRGSSYPV